MNHPKWRGHGGCWGHRGGVWTHTCLLPKPAPWSFTQCCHSGPDPSAAKPWSFSLYRNPSQLLRSDPGGTSHRSSWASGWSDLSRAPKGGARLGLLQLSVNTTSIGKKKEDVCPQKGCVSLWKGWRASLQSASESTFPQTRWHCCVLCYGIKPCCYGRRRLSYALPNNKDEKRT